MRFNKYISQDISSCPSHLELPPVSCLFVFGWVVFQWVTFSCLGGWGVSEQRLCFFYGIVECCAALRTPVGQSVFLTQHLSRWNIWSCFQPEEFSTNSSDQWTEMCWHRINSSTFKLDSTAVIRNRDWLILHIYVTVWNHTSTGTHQHDGSLFSCVKLGCGSCQSYPHTFGNQLGFTHLPNALYSELPNSKEMVQYEITRSCCELPQCSSRVSVETMSWQAMWGRSISLTIPKRLLVHSS